MHLRLSQAFCLCLSVSPLACIRPVVVAGWKCEEVILPGQPSVKAGMAAGRWSPASSLLYWDSLVWVPFRVSEHPGGIKAQLPSG